jgi:hypothetical protein
VVIYLRSKDEHQIVSTSTLRFVLLLQLISMAASARPFFSSASCSGALQKKPARLCGGRAFTGRKIGVDCQTGGGSLRACLEFLSNCSIACFDSA